MVSSYNIGVIIILIGISFGEVGCAATDVYSHGDSTTVVTQSGADGHTRVTRTADGQEVVSRSGGNIDISVQHSGASKSITSHSTSRSRNCAEDAGFFSSLRHMMWPSECDKPSIRGEGVPSSEEYKDRMLDRMRPVSPER